MFTSFYEADRLTAVIHVTETEFCELILDFFSLFLNLQCRSLVATA